MKLKWLTLREQHELLTSKSTAVYLLFIPLGFGVSRHSKSFEVVTSHPTT